MFFIVITFSCLFISKQRAKVYKLFIYNIITIFSFFESV